MTNSTTPVSLADLIAEGKVETGPRFLDKDGKEAYAEAATPFTITSIGYYDDAENGPGFQVEAEDKDGPFSFRLTNNDKRNPLMESLASVAATQPITGVRLKAYKGGFGNKYITIEPA